MKEILKELLGLGVASKAAQAMVNQNHTDRLREAMALTQQQTDLQNPAFFLVEALNGHWRDP